MNFKSSQKNVYHELFLRLNDFEITKTFLKFTLILNSKEVRINVNNSIVSNKIDIFSIKILATRVRCFINVRATQTVYGYFLTKVCNFIKFIEVFKT